MCDRDEDDPWNTTLGRHYKSEVNNLIGWGLSSNNIYIYNGCAGSFGVDLTGNVGEP